MIRVVSPHLDDAVLSLGQTMLGFKDRVEIVTMFAGAPGNGAVTDYDRSTGFLTSDDAMAARRDEDERACFQLGVTPRHLNFLDQQYDRPRDTQKVYELLVEAIRPLFTGPDGRPCVVCAPLGLGHPDHFLVANAALRALPFTVGNTRVALWLYEELPYRVMDPIAAVHRLDAIRTEYDGGIYEVAELTEPWEQGPRHVKAQAIAEYGSQFPNGADDPQLLCPERAWRVVLRRER